MRKLVIAWVITLSFFIGVITWLQISYEPAPGVDEATGEAASKVPAAAEPEPAEAIDDDPGPMPTLEIPAADPTLGIPATDIDGGPEGIAPASDDAEQAPDSGSPAPGNGLAVEGSLTEEGPYGPLPITRDGRQPWRVYAREYDNFANRPKVAIIISGLGLNQRTTGDAINILPSDVTLAFSPYGQDLPSWAGKAREAGHELLVMVPMEPLDYPVNDPGPHSLLTSLSSSENIDNLHYVMSRFQDYVGLMNDMGSRFTASEDSLRPIMAALQRHGVLFLDARTTSATILPAVARLYGVPTVSNSRYIDNVAAGSEIDSYLAELENLARARGSAVGIGRAYPITIARVAEWSRSLEEKGIDLAPITAIVQP